MDTFKIDAYRQQDVRDQVPHEYMNSLAAQYAQKLNAPPPKKPVWGTRPLVNMITMDEPKSVGTGPTANAATE